MSVIFTDAGTGANANPIGGSYVTLSGWADIQRTGNQLANGNGSDTDCGARINVATPNDHYCKVTTAVVGGRDGGPMVRCQSAAASGVLITDYNAIDVEAYVFVSGSFGSFKDRDVGTYTAGGEVYLEAQGTTYISKINGATINNFTDATFSSGQGGVFMYAADQRFTNIEVGDFNASALPAYESIVWTRRNRPGRGPYSKGAYRRPNAESFSVNVPNPWPDPTILYYAERTGSRENRPGRGPYSLGRYYVRSRLDVITLGLAPRSFDLGLVTESDSAFSLGKTKQRSIGLNTEADSVLAATRLKSKSIGLNTESDSAFSLVGTHNMPVGLVSESDSATAISHIKLHSMGLITEADSALAMTHSKSKALGVCTESDWGFSIRPNRLRATGLCTEADSALAFAHTKKRALGIPEEFDSAMPIRPPGASGGYGFMSLPLTWWSK